MALFEGSLPRQSIKFRTDHYQALEKSSTIPSDYTPEFWDKSNQELRKEIGLNCWHMNDFESAAMWRLYLKSNEGVAIQSTYARLRDSFKTTDTRVFIGTLNYIDYENEFIQISNSILPYKYKRKSFEHEHELRCLIWLFEQKSFEYLALELGGVKVKIDVINLIENIFLSPDSPKWLTLLLQDILKKYELTIPVINSGLNAKPLF